MSGGCTVEKDLFSGKKRLNSESRCTVEKKEKKILFSTKKHLNACTAKKFVFSVENWMYGKMSGTCMKDLFAAEECTVSEGLFSAKKHLISEGVSTAEHSVSSRVHYEKNRVCAKDLISVDEISEGVFTTEKFVFSA